MTIDINFLRIAVTVVSFAMFVGIVAWAASARNRQRFDEAARIPLDDDETLSPTLSHALTSTGARERGGERGTRFREGEA
jgi:cytochrome c oxidase cbb3-type subunit 4